MKVGIVGTGYVGLVTGTCFAELGHDVTCLDVVMEKVNKINKGITPIYEPGLEELLKKNIREKRLFATSNYGDLKDAEIIFICVGTPPKPTGESDLSYVRRAAEQIKETNPDAIVVVKSTVPPGTTLSLNLKNPAMNPEFLKEGVAVEDFMKPDRLVVGALKKENAEKVLKLYEKLKVPQDRQIVTDPTTAELIKYASNAFLAAKISFINEMANICERIGADVKVVAKGMGLDSRIGERFLNAGAGWGGSCFGKDVKAIMHTAIEANYEPKILESVIEVNYNQALHVIALMERAFEERKIKGKRIAILGLAFKPDTDDVRDAAALRIIRELAKEYEITAHDPIAIENTKKELERDGIRIHYSRNWEECLKNKDACLLITEWKEYREIPLKRFKELLAHPILIDGRRIYSPEEAKKRGIHYKGVGYGKK